MAELTAQEREVRDVYLRFDDAMYQRGDVGAADELVAEDFRHHALIPTPQGRDGFKQFITQFRQAFPDATSTTEDMVLQGDRVAVRYTMRGTHKGEFVGVPGSGNSVEVTGISIYRIVDGKVTDEWASPDIMGMMRQIGAAPASA